MAAPGVRDGASPPCLNFKEAAPYEALLEVLPAVGDVLVVSGEAHPNVLGPAGTTRAPGEMIEARLVPSSLKPGGILNTVSPSPSSPSSL